jgi:sugar-specific transcriptional regulator TrmB
MENIEIVKKLGLSEKASKLYIASLELGEATVNDLARQSKIKRTTIYYVLDELIDMGALILTKRNRKRYYLPSDPKDLLKRVKERVSDFEDAIESLEDIKHSKYNKPRVYFLFGSIGFKEVWDKIFRECSGEYLIITNPSIFPQFVKEKYIKNNIIKTKLRLGLKSRHIVVDSEYNKKIVSRDVRENRLSKYLPKRYPVLFTEIICENFVAYISPKEDNLIMIIENDSFATTQKSFFENLWNSLPEISFGKK